MTGVQTCALPILFAQASIDFENSLKISDRSFTREGLAWSAAYLGDTLHRLERYQESKSYYKQAIDARTKATGKSPNSLINEAWLLISCLDLELRDPMRAIELAKMALQKSPSNSSYLTILAASHLRNGDSDECLKVLEQAIQSRKSRKDMIGFWQAMATWKKDEKVKAKDFFDKAVKRMNQSAPGDLKLRQLKQEAAILLGIELGLSPFAPRK